MAIAPDTLAPRRKRGAPGSHESAAIVLLLLGGFIVGIGWIAGVALLWTSRRWTTRDKLIGTFLPPGGLLTSLGVAAAVGLNAGEMCTSGGEIDAGGRFVTTVEETCTGGPSTAVQVILVMAYLLIVLVPIATAIYLARRARASAIAT